MVAMSGDLLRPFAHRLQSRPSLTAEAVTMARALEHIKPPDERVVDDPWAHLFLSTAARRTVAAWSDSVTGRVLRRLGATGTTYVPLRHRFIDDHLAAALDAGVGQVVLLGAGYDTRAYRFADQLDGRPVFEVDLAPISRAKAATIAKHEDEFPEANVVRVEIDFESQALGDVLDDAGFTVGGAELLRLGGRPDVPDARGGHGDTRRRVRAERRRFADRPRHVVPGRRSGSARDQPAAVHRVR